MREFRGSRRLLATVLAVVLALGVAAIAAASGTPLVALPGVMIVALAYGLFVLAARRLWTANSPASGQRRAPRAALISPHPASGRPLKGRRRGTL